jgi:hypothetical protein
MPDVFRMMAALSKIDYVRGAAISKNGEPNEHTRRDLTIGGLSLLASRLPQGQRRGHPQGLP